MITALTTSLVVVYGVKNYGKTPITGFQNSKVSSCFVRPTVPNTKGIQFKMT